MDEVYHPCRSLCRERLIIVPRLNSLRPLEVGQGKSLMNVPRRPTVSHFSYAPLFQGPHFLTKRLESNNLYDNLLLTFYLFDNIEKNILESRMRIILLLKVNFDKFWKMHVQAERLYFLFLFCARHYSWWSLWQKNTKNNLFIYSI